MAGAAGVTLTWEDFDDLSRVTPLIARVYPNGTEDVNAFHAAGGMAFIVRQLLDAGLAHEDIFTVSGEGMRAYQQEPFLKDGALEWREGAAESLNRDILRPVSDPFDSEGGIRLLKGNLGRAVMKTSAVKPAHRVGRSAGDRVSRTGRVDRRVPARRTGSRFRRRGSVPGPRR